MAAWGRLCWGLQQRHAMLVEPRQVEKVGVLVTEAAGGTQHRAGRSLTLVGVRQARSCTGRLSAASSRTACTLAGFSGRGVEQGAHGKLPLGRRATLLKSHAATALCSGLQLRHNAAPH